MQTQAPALYNARDNQDGLRAPRVEAFIREGSKAGWRPAARDKQEGRRVALILVDMQFDFVHPDGNLSVPGSLDDLKRINEFIYGQGESITSIYASLDTHNTFQIFFPSWWVYDDNSQHPDVLTMATMSASGEVVDMGGRRLRPLMHPLWSLKYVERLKDEAQKNLMLWTYHCINGTPGHALMPSLSEALAFHSAARHSQVTYITKGTGVRTEHYGIWEAEVPDPTDPGTALNTTILNAVGDHDLIYIAGEAKSHCVLATMQQTVSYFGATQPEVVRKLRFMTDCMSSVVVPGVDFDAMADAEIAKLVKQGAVLVKSTDPIG